MDLTDKKLSYILISSDKIDDISSVLWAKDYRVIPIKEYYKGNYKESIIAYSDIDNDELRKDAIFILNHFNHDSAIIKYLNESDTRNIFSDGSENLLSVSLYNTNFENKSYLYNGYSFSFIEMERYWKPTKKEDFKIGMIVEYFNNNKWYKQEVKNPSVEFDGLYKLLIKYDKIRVASK